MSDGMGSSEWANDQPVTAPPEHEHQWKYSYTYDDWWDGDSDDIYKCTVEGCKARQTRYVPR